MNSNKPWNTPFRLAAALRQLRFKWSTRIPRRDAADLAPWFRDSIAASADKAIADLRDVETD